jgi:putative inorganic carbon (HCO3(-)) transporter
MMGARLPRVELAWLGWALGATLLAIGGGVFVAIAPNTAMCAGAVAIAAALVARYPLPALIVILSARAALPNSVLIGFLTLGAGAVALVFAAPSLPAKRVVLPFLALLLIAIGSVPFLPSPDEGYPQAPLRIPVLGTVYARAPSSELLEWMNLASVLVVFCLAAWAVTTRARLRLLVGTVLVSAVIPILIALQQLATGDTVVRSDSTLESLQGPFTYPNYFGFYLLVVAIVAIVAFMETRTLATRVALGALLAASLVCLFLTYTRAAWIGFAIALVVLALVRYRRLLVVAAAALIVAALVAPGAANKAQERFGDLASKSEANNSNSWTWRVDQWTAVLPYGLDRPATGQGFGSYSRMTVRRFGRFDHRYPTVEDANRGVFSPEGFTAHNDYVKLLVEMGFPGLVLWLIVFAGVIWTAARARRIRGLEAVGAGMLALTVALMLISVSDNLQGYSVVLMYAFALCGGLAGLAAAGGRHERAELRPPAAVAFPPATQPDPVPATEPAAEPEQEPDSAPIAEPERLPPTLAGRGRAYVRGLLKRRRGGP